MTTDQVPNIERGERDEEWRSFGPVGLKERPATTALTTGAEPSRPARLTEHHQQEEISMTSTPATGTFVRNLVPLEAIAKVLKRTVVEIRDECADFGFFVARDWADRPGIDESEAHQLVTGEARRTREAEAEWQAFQARCADWTTARDQAVRDAHDAVGADPRSGPEKHSAAREAATEAGRRFEAANPPPTFVPGVEDGVAVRRYSERDAMPAGLLDKARDILAGSPR